MSRGYYTVLVTTVRAPHLSAVCPHRHYKISGGLARCLRQRGGHVIYVDAQGNRRPIRSDERAELRSHHA
jgi:hypothetical protein